MILVLIAVIVFLFSLNLKLGIQSGEEVGDQSNHTIYNLLYNFSISEELQKLSSSKFLSLSPK